jgi:L-lactate dehydrogenase complex protein LldG
MASTDTAHAAIQNPGRVRILVRIRAALSQPAPQPDMTPVPLETIFPPIPNPLDRFLAECAGNLTECILTDSPAASAAAIASIVAGLPPGEVFLQETPPLRNISAALPSDRPLRWSSDARPSESCQVSITAAEALIAQTGSVVTSASCGGRGGSIVPPCHIVHANLRQLVPDLTTALVAAQQSGVIDRNSFVGVITGSSRTADIEKILVQGAHGPRRLVVVLEKTEE